MTFGTTPHAMVGTLCFWRFLLGVGVGGDYPLSATVMSEYSSTVSRGAYIGSVFAMQAFGFLFAAQPHRNKTTWSFPCDRDSDLYLGSNGERLGCKVKNACPTGRVVTSTDVPGLCDFCDPKLLSGCAPFGLGVQGSLGILAAINFIGLLTSFMIPETMGKTLEELNGQKAFDETAALVGTTLTTTYP